MPAKPRMRVRTAPSRATMPAASMAASSASAPPAPSAQPTALPQNRWDATPVKAASDSIAISACSAYQP